VGNVDGDLEPRFPPPVGDSAPRRAWLRAAISLVVLAAVTGMALHAHAADPRESCRRRQLAAASKLYKQSYGCWATAFGKLQSLVEGAAIVRQELG